MSGRAGFSALLLLSIIALGLPASLHTALAAPQLATLLWQRDDLWVDDVAVSPDGRVVYLATRGGVLALNASSGEEVWSVDLDVALSVDVCYDGMVAVLSSEEVLVIDPVGSPVWSSPLALALPERGQVARGLVRWSPDCSRLAFGVKATAERGWRGGIGILGRKGEVVCGVDLEAGVSSVQWSRDGSVVAIGIESGRILAVNSSCRHVWTTAPLSFPSKVSISWSESSSRLVSGHEYAEISCYSERGRKVWSRGTLGLPVASLDWGPPGIAVAAGQRVLLFDDEGNLLWATEDLGRPTSLVDWSPEGDLLAVLSRRWFLLVDPEGRQVLSSGLLPGIASALSWSPTGGALFVAGDFGVEAFAVAPVEVSSPESVILLEGSDLLTVRLFNPLPTPTSAHLTASLDGVVIEDGVAEIPSYGVANFPLNVSAEPGMHILEIDCEANELRSSSLTEVLVIENLSVAGWALTSPGSPVNLTVAITNPNSLSLGVRVDVYEGAERIIGPTWLNLSPGVQYLSWMIPLDPGDHSLDLRISGPAGIILASHHLRVPVMGASIPLELRRPSGFVLEPWNLTLAVENPYTFAINVTVEVYVDGGLISEEALSIPPERDASLSIPLSSGKHSTYVRVLAGGKVLAEEDLQVTVLPRWMPTVAPLLVAGVIAPVLWRLRRSRGA